MEDKIILISWRIKLLNFELKIVLNPVSLKLKSNLKNTLIKEYNILKYFKNETFNFWQPVINKDEENNREDLNFLPDIDKNIFYVEIITPVIIILNY